MTFPVTVLYMNHPYTYDVDTTDGVHFTCKLRPVPHAEGVSAPPEMIVLEKEKQSHLDTVGAYRIQLHTDLMAGVDTYLRQSHID